MREWEKTLLESAKPDGLENEALMIQKIRQFKIRMRQHAREFDGKIAQLLEDDVAITLMFSFYMSGMQDMDGVQSGIT